MDGPSIERRAARFSLSGHSRTESDSLPVPSPSDLPPECGRCRLWLVTPIPLTASASGGVGAGTGSPLPMSAKTHVMSGPVLYPYSALIRRLSGEALRTSYRSPRKVAFGDTVMIDMITCPVTKVRDPILKLELGSLEADEIESHTGSELPPAP